jgi:hypothetical protein
LKRFYLQNSSEVAPFTVAEVDAVSTS